MNFGYIKLDIVVYILEDILALIEMLQLSPKIDARVMIMVPIQKRTVPFSPRLRNKGKIHV